MKIMNQLWCRFGSFFLVCCYYAIMNQCCISLEDLLFPKMGKFQGMCSRADGARICVEMDISRKPLKSFWLGTTFHPSSRRQEIIYETLLDFCQVCRIQDIWRRHVENKGPKRKRRTIIWEYIL